MVEVSDLSLFLMLALLLLSLFFSFLLVLFLWLLYLMNRFVPNGFGVFSMIRFRYSLQIYHDNEMTIPPKLRNGDDN